MRRLFTLILIFIAFLQTPSEAFLFHKKNYKQIMLHNAISAAKRHDDNSAFHNFEEAMYYYKKDKQVIETYAQFCEQRNYLDKATKLYSKLYTLTKDKKYLFKANICAIKDGKLSDKQIEEMLNNRFSNYQTKELNKAAIYHFAYKKNWKKIKEICNKLAIQDIDEEIITACITASEKTWDKRNILKYSIRKAQLFPKDSDAMNKVIKISKELNDLKTESVYVKKLSALNPNDNGIQYELAGIYEKEKNWKEAAKVYKRLLSKGDKSTHVKSSYKYVLSQLYKKQTSSIGSSKKSFFIFKPKPLSKFQLAETQFYNLWKIKDYNNAQRYLSIMLNEQPDNKKLLKYRVDIDVSQNNYSKAISDFSKLDQHSVNDTEFLAFLYSKTNQTQKSLEIIETKLQDKQITKSEYQYLANLALQYSLANKDWDRALNYAEILLTYNPDSEKLIKTAGDMNAIKKDFVTASEYYEKLIRKYPKVEYKKELANLYMASHNFGEAENILGPLYMKNQNDKDITDSYINSLLAQKKIREAYWVVRNSGLENTSIGYSVLGDLAMENKDYDAAKNYYCNSLSLDSKNIMLQNKLADCCRLLGEKGNAYSIYNEILDTDPDNLDAKVGIGYLKIDEKNYNAARQIFSSILDDKPDYTPAKMGIVYSYLANDEKFKSLKYLDNIDDTDETKLLRAQIYYDMNMPTNSNNILDTANTNKSKELKYKIKRDNAITITPTYSFEKDQLSGNYRLDYNMWGLKVSQNIDPNTNVFFNYNIYVYSSADFEHLNNVTHELRGGVHGKPTKKFEYNTDLGAKIFEFGNSPMLVTNDWIKYRFNDKFALKLGFSRDNLQQTYTSGVGRYINGIFTGRVANTRTYLEYDLKLPKDFYSFGRGCYGVMYGQNMLTNQYMEGMLGIGKLLYNNLKNPIIQKINFDLVSFNWAFQHNLLNIYDNTGTVFGGYFSPSFFSSDTGNIRLEGELKKIKLKYGVTGFAGIQVCRGPDFTNFTWGFGPYISYKINDHIDIRAAYNFYNWGDMKQHLFMVNAVIRGFKRNAKN